MNNSTIFLKGTIVLAITFFLSSCKKLQDYILSHPGATHPNCRITKFNDGSVHYPKTGIVYYNKYGNPDSVKFDNISTGQPNLYMFYDKKQQLTNYIGLYPGVGADTTGSEDGSYDNDLQVAFNWSKYMYDAKGRVVIDTTYGDVLWEPGSDRPLAWGNDEILFSVSKLEYDSKDRVIKRTTDLSRYGLQQRIEVFEYDANGNLVRPNRKYDNHISFLRTHKIWMFLMLDYSANNAYAAEAYNSNGLPTKFYLGPTDYDFPGFLFTNMRQATIEYECK